jgi:hypothetical protein
MLADGLADGPTAVDSVDTASDFEGPVADEMNEAGCVSMAIPLFEIEVEASGSDNADANGESEEEDTNEIEGSMILFP